MPKIKTIEKTVHVTDSTSKHFPHVFRFIKFPTYITVDSSYVRENGNNATMMIKEIIGFSSIMKTDGNLHMITENEKFVAYTYENHKCLGAAAFGATPEEAYAKAFAAVW